MRRFTVSTSLFAFAVSLVAVSAEAQTYQPAAAPAPAYYASSANSGHGRGIGVGAVSMLNGVSGVLFTWGNAGGSFHIDAFTGLRYHRPSNYTTDIAAGGRFWYHMHAASFADFSLGGGLGVVSWTENPGTPNSDSKLDLVLQAGGQIRAFLVPNVALIADLGLGLYFGDSDNVMLGGQSAGGGASPSKHGDFVSGSMGIAYFFE